MCNNQCKSYGLIAGLVAGIVIAFFLILNGLSITVGNVLGVHSQLGGIIIHLLASMLGGVSLALLLNEHIHSWVSALTFGSLLSLGVWLIGPMTLIPSLAEGEALFSNWNIAGLQASFQSLAYYLIYGLILGFVYFFLKKGKLHSLKRPRTIKQGNNHFLT